MTSIGARHHRFGLLKVVVPAWVVKDCGQSVSRRKTQGNERKIFGVLGTRHKGGYLWLLRSRCQRFTHQEWRTRSDRRSQQPEPRRISLNETRWVVFRFDHRAAGIYTVAADYAFHTLFKLVVVRICLQGSDPLSQTSHIPFREVPRS